MTMRSNFKTSESYNPDSKDGYAIYDGPAEELTFASREFFDAWVKRTRAILFANRSPVASRVGAYAPINWVLGPEIYLVEGHYILPVITPVPAQVITASGQSVRTPGTGNTTTEDRKEDAADRNADAMMTETCQATIDARNHPDSLKYLKEKR